MSYTTMPMIKSIGECRIFVTAFDTSGGLIGIRIAKGGVMDEMETTFYIQTEVAAAFGSALIAASQTYASRSGMAIVVEGSMEPCNAQLT